MKGASPRQRFVLLFLADHIRRHGYAPTLTDICAHLGATSTNAAHDILRALEKKGFIKRKPKIARGLRLTGKADLELRLIAAERDAEAALGHPEPPHPETEVAP